MKRKEWVANLFLLDNLVHPISLFIPEFHVAVGQISQKKEIAPEWFVGSYSAAQYLSGSK